MKAFKIPESVLVVIYTPAQDVLLIRRVDSGTWQSVTGSKDADDQHDHQYLDQREAALTPTARRHSSLPRQQGMEAKAVR